MLEGRSEWQVVAKTAAFAGWRVLKSNASAAKTTAKGGISLD